MNDDSVVSDSRLSLTCIKSNPYFPHALLICVQLCFSGWHIVGSICLKDGANPLIFALYREGIVHEFIDELILIFRL